MKNLLAVSVCWERDTDTYFDARGILADEEREHRTPHVHLGSLVLILEGLLDGPVPMVKAATK